MKYVVAWMNFFDNDLQMILVEARDPITAMVKGARQLMGDNSENNEWLDPMLEDIPEPEGYAARIEEIREEFNNTDQVVAVMLPINRETYRMDVPEDDDSFDKDFVGADRHRRMAE